MKKIYIKPEVKLASHVLSANINVTSWDVDHKHEGWVIEGDPEGEIDSKSRNWYDKDDWNSWE